MHDRPDLARPDVVLSLDDVRALALRVLAHHGLSDAHARAIANVITQGQRDEYHSHGVYRLLVCARSLRLGKVDPQAVPTLRRLSPSIVAVDAHRGFSLLAFETACRCSSRWRAGTASPRWRSTAATTSRRCGRRSRRSPLTALPASR